MHGKSYALFIYVFPGTLTTWGFNSKLVKKQFIEKWYGVCHSQAPNIYQVKWLNLHPSFSIINQQDTTDYVHVLINL